MKNMKLALTTTIIFALAGCDNAKTIDWYKSNPDELSKAYESCMKSGENSTDCSNAKTAHHALWQKEQKQAPVVDLNNLNGDKKS